MGILDLLWEICVWIFQGIAPTERSIRIARALLRISFWLSPIAGIGFMFGALHGQWPMGYFIAGIVTILPVVLFEALRRGSKAAAEIAAKLVGLAATFHTWLAIVNFWLACLQPTPEYVLYVYGATTAITLFMVCMSRWDKPMRWYRFITGTALVLPAVYAVLIVILGSLAPDTMAGARVQWHRLDQEGAKQRFGQNFDQNIGRAIATAIGYSPDRRTEIMVRVGEPLWRRAGNHELFRDGTYYAQYFRQSGARTMQPDLNNVVWFPENKVGSAQMVGTKVVRLPAMTNYWPDNHGQPGNNVRHIRVPLDDAEVTSSTRVVDGRRVYFGRMHDRYNIYDVWWEVDYNAL